MATARASDSCFMLDYVRIINFHHHIIIIVIITFPAAQHHRLWPISICTARQTRVNDFPKVLPWSRLRQDHYIITSCNADREWACEVKYEEQDLSAEDLINGSRLFESTLIDDALSLLFHEEHERVERLLDVLASSIGRLQATDVVMTRWPDRRRRHRRSWSAAVARAAAVERRSPVFSAEFVIFVNIVVSSSNSSTTTI